MSSGQQATNKIDKLASDIKAALADNILKTTNHCGELTIEVPSEHIVKVVTELRDNANLQFEQLMDLCAVDYLHYGCSQWSTQSASSKGFERGVQPISETNPESTWKKPRFSVVYHLLSIKFNRRLRVKAFVSDADPVIDSVVEIYNSANWYEREAFDLYGILFANHPDLRRLLTDYGFIGHPFRKDFPLIGNVACRYDATLERVIYEPVDIEERTLVPKVIRKPDQEFVEDNADQERVKNG